jgi:hypothetical protein
MVCFVGFIEKIYVQLAKRTIKKTKRRRWGGGGGGKLPLDKNKCFNLQSTQLSSMKHIIFLYLISNLAKAQTRLDRMRAIQVSFTVLSQQLGQANLAHQNGLQHIR